jgi:hypothetical protein
MESHLRGCPACAAEIEEARRTHEWMELLVPERWLAPGPDFYAHVSMRIEAGREQADGMLAVLFPVLGRQLGMALVMLLLLLGGFLLTVRRPGGQPNATAIFMRSPAQVETPVMTSDTQVNRERVMQAIVTPAGSVEGD